MSYGISSGMKETPTCTCHLRVIPRGFIKKKRIHVLLLQPIFEVFHWFLDDPIHRGRKCSLGRKRSGIFKSNFTHIISY